MRYLREVAQLVAHHVRDVGVGRSSRLFSTKRQRRCCLFCYGSSPPCVLISLQFERLLLKAIFESPLLDKKTAEMLSFLLWLLSALRSYLAKARTIIAKKQSSSRLFSTKKATTMSWLRDPCRIQTCNPHIRSVVLYSVELTDHCFFKSGCKGTAFF